MSWTIEYTDAAIKDMRRINRASRLRLDDTLIELVARHDSPRDFTKPLHGPLKGFVSRRVGDYRVICEIIDSAKILRLVAVGNRDDIYTRFNR